MDDAVRHCENLVREHDKDRYLAALFAPAQQRGALFAIYAFNVEIVRVAAFVREPMAGEIRLQWWRDVLNGERNGEAAANPVAAALRDTIARFALPTEPLLRLLEARAFDLYDDPMPDVAALEAYLDATSSGLIALAAFIPLGILTWGRPAGEWTVIYFLSGLVALAASAALGALNLSLLRRNSGSLQSSRDVE